MGLQLTQRGKADVCVVYTDKATQKSCAAWHTTLPAASLEMRFLWASGAGKTLVGKMGLDLGCEKWWSWLGRVAGKGNPGKKDCLEKCVEIRTTWSLCGKRCGQAPRAGKSHEGCLESWVSWSHELGRAGNQGEGRVHVEWEVDLFL